ncbi:4'-phosphopantetheinyl transferase family protein [Spirochaetota bacterium]
MRLFNKTNLPLSDINRLKNEVHIYYASLNVDPGKLDFLKQKLSLDEIERAEKFKFKKDHDSYVHSRGLLRIILSSYLDIENSELHFNYNSFGKPEIRGIDFNLSHSKGMVIYGFTLGREIGIDIEKILPKENSQEIVERFFSEAEKEDYNNLPHYLKIKAFWHCWTRKEAYMKAHGRGLNLPLNQFSVSLLPEKDIKLVHKKDGIDEGVKWTIKDLKVNDQFAAALAYKGNEVPLFCRQI